MLKGIEKWNLIQNYHSYHPKFTQAYPPATYPELMHKHGRPYTCLLIDSHDDYFDSITAAIADQDEYTEMMKNLPTIVQEANDYVDTYINHINGTTPLHPREFSRKYQYSTLPYFHDIMEI